MTSKNKSALITGSSRGIGRGIALKLAEQKIKIAINYVKNEAAAKETLAKVREKGSDGFMVQADVCQPQEIQRMFAKVKSEFGNLDIFVSNARTDLPPLYHLPMHLTFDHSPTTLNPQA